MQVAAVGDQGDNRERHISLKPARSTVAHAARDRDSRLCRHCAIRRGLDRPVVCQQLEPDRRCSRTRRYYPTGGEFNARSATRFGR